MCLLLLTDPPTTAHWLSSGGPAPAVHAASVISVNTTADAADIVLDTVCDSDPAPGEQCTLRAAIQEANATPSSPTDPTTIVLSVGTYALTLVPLGDDSGASGDLDISTNVKIQGLGADKTIINGGGVADRVFDVISGTVEIQFVTVRNGSSIGGVGGIYNHTPSSLTLKDSIVASNSGAGILNSNSALTVTKTTISGNGGGISILSGTVNVNNSTISSNSGNGIDNDGGTVSLRNVTITQNSAVSGGGIKNDTGTLRLKNSLVAGNNATSGPDCWGTLTSEGYNLIQNTAAPCNVTGDTTGNLTGSPGLDTQLKNNGGAMQTHALLTGSPALDAGAPQNVGGCVDHNGEPLATDQRGVARPQGARCDIGAYEAIKLRFNSAPYSRAENLGPATIPITLSGNSPITVTVNYSTTNGTAIAGNDYVAASGELTFKTSKTFNITLINDEVYEPNETLTVTLNNLSGAVFESPAANVTTLTIMNDDTPKVYLPLAMKNYSRYFSGPEVEPNNNTPSANGPLGSGGSGVSGLFNDVRDYYFFDANAGTITADLTNVTASGVQLQLFYQSTSNLVTYDPTPPYSIQVAGRPAGRYIIIVYKDLTQPGMNTAYNLTVTYPP